MTIWLNAPGFICDVICENFEFRFFFVSVHQESQLFIVDPRIIELIEKLSYDGAM